MIFVYPWAFFLPLFYVVIRLMKRVTHIAASTPNQKFLQLAPKSLRQALRSPVLELLSFLLVCLLTLCAARPQFQYTTQESDKARNIMLTLDVSPSMETADFLSSRGYDERMAGVKKVVAEYVRSRTDDRVGLVVFAGRAFLQSPLTTDLKLVSSLVDRLSAGIAGDGTAIGDGLGLALKRMREVSGDSKAIILITDGVQTAGSINPITAAHTAKDLVIKIHTIGIGMRSQPNHNAALGGFFGLQGANAGADFDEEMLKSIAQTTGGVYFNAETLQGLKEVYKDIERLTASEDKPRSRTITEDLGHYFLKASVLVFLTLIVLTHSIFARTP